MVDSSVGWPGAPQGPAIVRRLRLLAPPHEEAFDRLTRIASAALGAPIALITLVDEERQLLRSCVGLPEPVSSRREAPLRDSICQHVVGSGEPLAIADAREHPLVRDSPAILDLGVTAYAGSPLRLRSGEVIGTVCAIDTRPHCWTPEEMGTLSDLAAAVVHEIECLVPLTTPARSGQDSEAGPNSANRELREANAALRAELEERSRVHEGLRESEEQFRQIAENIREVFWMFNPDFTETIYVSPAYEEIWGQPLSSIYADAGSFLLQIHPEDAGATISAMGLLKEGSDVRLEYRILRPDGSVRWAWVRGFPIFDERGTVYRVVGTVEDITERRAAESHYRRLVETAPQTIFALDVDGCFTELNPAGEQLLERSTLEVLGRHFAEVVEGDTLAAAEDAFANLISGERKRLNIELQVRRPSGECRRIRVYVAGVGENGIVTGTHGVAWDITEERQGQVALEAAHTRLEHILATGPTILYTLRVAGNGSIESLWMSDNLASILGYEASDALEPGWWVAGLHPEDRDDALAFLRPLRVGHFSHEYRFRHADGGYRWVHDELRAVESVAGSPFDVVGSWTDVTEQRRSEEVVRESERSYRSLFDSLTELVYILDLDGHFLSVNEAVLARYGYEREEILGATPALLADPERMDLERLQDHVRKAIEGAPQRFEFRARTKAGENFTKEVSLTRGTYFGASVVIAVAQDITERKQAEDALSAAESHYRRLVETAPLAIYALDREGRFIELNPAGERLLECSAGDVLGQHFSTVIVPADHGVATDGFERVISGEADDIEFEERIRRPSGVERLILVTESAIREGEAITGTHGIARDITEERARQEEKRLLRAALEGLDEGVTITRSDGQILYANSRHAQLMGYDRARAALPNVLDAMSAEEAREAKQILQVVFEQGTWAGRVQQRRFDTGRLVPLEMIIGRVDRPGDESLIFTVARDATKEIEREQHLRRTERLASVGTLIGGVAHELNNPLHAIASFAQILLMEKRSPDDQEAMEVIRREAERAAKIVSDLRLIARQTQDAEGERASVDLNGVVRHALKVRRYSLETGSVDVREDLAGDLPPVLANRGELEQVVLNLVVNAEQAMEGQSGEHRLIVRTRRTSEGATLSIIDTGSGIAPQHMERIFDPFFTTKSPGEGTGLGLPLVHSIVSEHGGKIHVDSEPGKGTAFRIDLPRSAAPAPSIAAGKPPAAAARALRVLVVDDEAAIRRVTVRFLERLGYRVDTAAEGEAALRLLEATAYDAILSDLRMPGLGGEELFRRLCERGQGVERRLIFVTGDAASAQAVRLVTEAHVPVLVKPVRLEDLAGAIESVVGELASPEA